MAVDTGLPLGPVYPGSLPSSWPVMSGPHLDEILLHYQQRGAAGHVGNEGVVGKIIEFRSGERIAFFCGPTRKEKPCNDERRRWTHVTCFLKIYFRFCRLYDF
jgi:hypothetical protein